MKKDKIPLKTQYEIYLLGLMMNNLEETYELKTLTYEEFIKVKNKDLGKEICIGYDKRT